MADPTLDTTATYAGMSVNEMMEEVLRRRGLTLDSDTTGRVEATAAEQADIIRFLKRAHTLFNTEYPESYSIERTAGTWTADDTAIMLPANCMMVLSFYINGRFVKPIEMEDLRRSLRQDKDATSYLGWYGASTPDSGNLYWRISGVADANAVANGGDGLGPVDWRPVLQIYGLDPDGEQFGADPYVFDFVRFGEAFTSGTTPVRVHPVVQEWVIPKAASLWASAENDEITKGLAFADLLEIMPALWAAFDSRGDTASRARWTYPVLANQTRGS